jgi:predicted transcriptional regulator
MPDRPHLVHMLVEPDLLHQVQEAAERHTVTVAAWLRHAMRQVILEDFPDGWRAGEGGSRSHESGYYDRRFQLRLDPHTRQKLETFMQTFDRSAAEIIRQLIAQALPEEFPQSWQIAADELRAQPMRPGDHRTAARGRLGVGDVSPWLSTYVMPGLPHAGCHPTVRASFGAAGVRCADAAHMRVTQCHWTVCSNGREGLRSGSEVLDRGCSPGGSAGPRSRGAAYRREMRCRHVRAGDVRHGPSRWEGLGSSPPCSASGSWSRRGRRRAARPSCLIPS